MTAILILDDKGTNRNIYSRLAQTIEPGVAVHSFASPLHALGWLEYHTPDLIVTDFRMPDMDGAEFTKHVRESANGLDVPIIVITAYDDRAFRLSALEAGATDFLRSPVDHYEFVTRARNLLKLQRQQQQLKGRALALEHQLRISERSQEELVRSSREALAQVIDTVPAMISATDKDGRIVFVNAHLAGFVESTPEALTGEPLSDIIRTSRPDLRRRVDQSIIADQRESVRFEETIYDPAGGERVFLTTKTSLIAVAGPSTNVLTTSIDITEQKQAENTMRHIASHDILTDLPNRRMLNEWIQKSLSIEDNALAVLLIDLDRFKSINDALGHSGGDRMLQLVTQRLLETVSGADLVARMSGDEFVVVQANIRSASEPDQLARKIIGEMNAPFILEENELRIGCSVGIALAPHDGKATDELLRHADLAMYKAKAEGRNTVCFYSPDLDSSSSNSINLETALRNAIDRDEFELHYQPQIDLRTGLISGGEALLRWVRPEFGLTLPGVFIGIAEETGLISEIGAWVLENACLRGASLQAVGGSPVRIAVNLSPVQFLRQDIVRLVDDNLRKSGLNPEFLELELTESSLLRDVERTRNVLQDLKSLGVKIAIDDFGVGFSSLSYLKNFAVDTLKIDRSFIASLLGGSRDEAIVKAIVSLAQSLGLKVVAEGVENNSQLLCLAEYGCDEAQGYLFSRPVPASNFKQLLTENLCYLPAREMKISRKVRNS